jgi:hypothetical protein
MRGRARKAAVAAALLLGAGAMACGEAPSGGDAVLVPLDPVGLRSTDQSADPSLAVDPETGELLLAWAGASDGIWNLYFARSEDGGSTFSAPRRVNEVPGDVHPHAEGAPRLVAAPGVAAVFWNNQYLVENRAFGAADLRFSRSTDGGESWAPARDLHDAPPSGLPGSNTFHGAAWAGDSTLVVAWLDGRDRDERRIERAVAAGVPREEAMADPESFQDPEDLHDGDAAVYAAYSHDLGATWEPSNRRIQEGLCPCCRITLVGGSGGEVYGTWRQNYPGSLRDPAFHDLNGPESGSIRIHADEWYYPGCPHSGPALDVDAVGTAHAAWYTGAPGRMGIQYATKPAAAPRFGAPVPILTGEAIPIAHPSLVALPEGGAVIAHNVDAEGRRAILLTGVSAEGGIRFRVEAPDSEGGTHPQLVRLPAGELVVAWTESRGGLQRVRLARLEGVEP